MSLRSLESEKSRVHVKNKTLTYDTELTSRNYSLIIRFSGDCEPVSRMNAGNVTKTSKIVSLKFGTFLIIATVYLSH